MIIVEGPDGAGKSTLVQQLCERFELQVGPRAVADRDKLYTVTRQDTYTALGVGFMGAAPPYVYDRLFFSDMVYSRFMDRECEFSADEQRFIRRSLNLLQVPIILCLPPLDVVRDNAMAAKQMKGVTAHINAIYNHYADPLFLGGMAFSVMYDYTGTRPHLGRWATLPNLFAIVERYINDRRFREWTGSNSSESTTPGSRTTSQVSS